MSSHYSMTVHLRLDDTLAADDRAMLAYLFNAQGPRPQSPLPYSAYLAHYAQEPEAFWREWHDQVWPRNDPYQEREIVRFWSQPHTHDDGCDSGIDLHFTSMKIESLTGVRVGILPWLATLSCDRGYVGAIHCEDDPSGRDTMILAVFDHTMHFWNVPRTIEMQPM